MDEESQDSNLGNIDPGQSLEEVEDQTKVEDQEKVELEELEELNEVVQYDDAEIDNYASSFNLTKDSSRLDMRNVKYKTATDHLCCPICQQPFIMPLTTVCGHTFCTDCIYECFRAHGTNQHEQLKGVCPLDRTPLDSTNVNDLFPTPLLIVNLVDELQVYCMNFERGCTWTGCRWELEHHVLSDCGYTGVRCNGLRHDCEGGYGETQDFEPDKEKTHDKDKVQVCSKLVQRRFVNEDGVCAHKLYKCKHCDAKVSCITEEEHLTGECPYNYQVCDLCLNDLIPMKNFEKHKQNCSKIRNTHCPASKIGCKWVGNNEPALEVHLESNCQLNQLLPFIETMNEKIDSLTTENQFLQRQINKILSLISQGKVTNLGYNEPVEEIKKLSPLGSLESQDKLLYLSYEIERLKIEMEEKVVPFLNRESGSINERESVINSLVNDNFMMKDDLNLQRVLINSLRKQLQFLLVARNPRGVNNPLMYASSSMENDNVDFFDSTSRSNSEERLNLKL